MKPQNRKTAGQATTTPEVLITGDISQDFNVYIPSTDTRPTGGIPHSRFIVSLGGAAIVHRLLEEVARVSGDHSSSFNVAFAADGGRVLPTASPVAGLWQPHPGEKFVQPDKTQVWRLTRSVALGDASDLSAMAPPPKLPVAPKDAAARLLVVEDDAGKFRFGSSACPWPEIVRRPPKKLEWIILKMTAPVCQGELWRHLVHRPNTADRLVVVVSVGDLRREDVRVSKGISWERTAIEVARELLHSPSLAGLRRAKHVIVTLHAEGAVWMERKDSGESQFRLVFDPQHMEGEWTEAATIRGEAYGFMSCFTAALVARIALSAEPKAKPDIEGGVECGIRVCRLLRLFGHGRVGAVEPGLPFGDLAGVIVGDKSSPTFGNDLKVLAQHLGRFGKATLCAKVAEAECEASSRTSKLTRGDCPCRWRILEGSEVDKGRPKTEPLYGVARRVATFGLQALRNAPCARFGKLLTADRNEIEALRNIKRLMLDYRSQTADHKPLSLAVFGPPGAGKSFGIKQIAEEVLGVMGEKVPFLEFNLSQFSDVHDLIGAFHQVRDKALEGQVPVVFWDEFDSQAYRWLQYLLAPMQDGRFQEGQITHPIGKCIFVFAGATTYDMANFGPPQGDLEEYTRFRLLKGPDFASRLNGFLNVLGPNRRLICPDSDSAKQRVWQEDPSDVCFPVRRALLLRSMLGLVGKRENERLEIDHGLLAALLEVDGYTHGARSMEKILQSLKGTGNPIIRRSALPTDEVLAMNVDLPRFTAIVGRARRFQEYARKLAPVIHADWRRNKQKKMKGKPFANDVAFNQLPDEIKAANMAAAMRIPRILELAGLYLKLRTKRAKSHVGGIKTQGRNADPAMVLESLVEILAEEEHILWMEFMEANGWRPGKPRNDSERIHDCLVPFAKLDPGTQDYDRNQVRKYPKYAEKAGFMITASMADSQ